jgi:translation initiation factor eIF-2B subunit alpha
MASLVARNDLIVPRDDVGIETMMTLVREAMDAIAKSEATTLNGLREDIEAVINHPRHDQVKSGGDLLKFRLLSCAAGRQQISELRDAMATFCQTYLHTAARTNDTVVNYVLPFIRDTSVVIAHGNGNVLAHCIASAIELRTGVRFYVTEGLPHGTGADLIQKVRRQSAIARMELRYGTDPFEALLRRSVATIPDSCVASLMHEADLVLCGANAVTEHGGLVHTTGSLQLAIIADAMRVPFYVLCETFKFSSIFPLSTAELYKDANPRRGIRSALSASTLPETESPEPASSSASSPTRFRNSFSKVTSVSSLDTRDAAAARGPASLWPIELVPPKLVSLIFSEDGIMPPSAVADQMLARRASSAGGG